MIRLPKSCQSLVLVLLLLGVSATAQAVPSFARQTGMPCSACHTNYPELTQFGRMFKLQGYTLASGTQIQQKDSKGSADLKIGEIPPLSFMVEVSGTAMQKRDPAGNQNGSVAFPQQASVFFAGAISNHMGAFVQMTYEQETGSIGWDNTDVRYARQFGGQLLGLTLNNNPTVQDLWNTTPAWGFPFASSAAANTPSAAVLLDGALAGDVGGLGGYGMFANHVYAEVTAYRSTHQGTAAPDPASANTVSGVAPYWRLAWQDNFGSSYLMVGTYGISARLFPTGFVGPTDQYTDYGVDSQFEQPFGSDMLAVRASYTKEKRKLDATFAASGSTNAEDSLGTARLNGTWHFGGDYAGSLGYFSTSGDSDALLYPGSASGSPASAGEIVEARYLPWQNVQVAAQYTLYNKFDGSSSDYDGSGRNARDNNTLYLLLWMVW
jgi:hypothetical protein